MPVYLVASLVAALGLHYAVERPFLLWKESLARRRPSEPARGGARVPAAELSAPHVA